MQHCETCGKDFYSDTEFESHQLMEQMTKWMEKGNPAFEKFAERLAWINGALECRNTLLIMQLEGVDFPTATTRYLEYAEIRNKMLTEHHERKKQLA